LPRENAGLFLHVKLCNVRMRRCTHSVARQNQDLRDETDIVTLDVITIFENDDS